MVDCCKHSKNIKYTRNVKTFKLPRKFSKSIV